MKHVLFENINAVRYYLILKRRFTLQKDDEINYMQF